jgi:hypothetical protein
MMHPWTVLGIDRGRTGDHGNSGTGEQDLLHGNLLWKVT